MSDVRKVSDSDAWALLALREAPVFKQTMENMNAWASGDIVCGKTPLEVILPLARLEGHEFEYTMHKSRVTIGRSTSRDDVDVKVGHSTFVSRVHLEICVDTCSVERPKFFIKCRGKNGIFVDDVFQQKGDEAMQLPHMYMHDIRLFFASYMNMNDV